MVLNGQRAVNIRVESDWKLTATPCSFIRGQSLNLKLSNMPVSYLTGPQAVDTLLPGRTPSFYQRVSSSHSAHRLQRLATKQITRAAVMDAPVQKASLASVRILMRTIPSQRDLICTPSRFLNWTAACNRPGFTQLSWAGS